MHPTYQVLAERMGDWMKKHLVTLPVHAKYPPYRIETATALAMHLEELDEFVVVTRSDLNLLRMAASMVPFDRVSLWPETRDEFAAALNRAKLAEETGNAPVNG